MRSTEGRRVAEHGSVPRQLTRIVLTGILLAGAFGWSPPALEAQVLAGRVTDAGSTAPVSAALVELLGEDSVQVAATLTDGAGRYRVTAAAPSTYSVRVRRLGYATHVAGPVALRDTSTLDIELRARPVELDGVVATARPACADGPGVGADTQTLWDLVLGALDVTRLAQELDAYRFEMHQYVREFDLPRSHLLVEGVQRTSDTGAFVAPPIDRLTRQGYLQPEGSDAMSWYMPDPEVLVSDHFLRSHCFRVVDGPHPGIVGLGFEPTPTRVQRRPDRLDASYRELVGEGLVEVRGVLWIDRATGALRDLEYEYAGLAAPEVARLAGGYARYEQLEGGVWIVRQWVVGMPNLDLEDGALVPSAIREVGGYVVDAARARGTSARPTASDRAPFARSGGGDVVGRLVPGSIDIGAGAAVARLSGSPFAARPDAEGRFAFHDVPPGPYVVTWWSPRLDSLDLPARAVDVVVEPGVETSVTLPGPDTEWATERLCRGMRVDPSLGVVRVLVHDEAGDPVEGRRVRLWTPNGEIERETMVRGGVATFCSVPTGVPVAIAPPRDPAPAIQIRLEPSEIRPVRLRVR